MHWQGRGALAGLGYSGKGGVHWQWRGCTNSGGVHPQSRRLITEVGALVEKGGISRSALVEGLRYHCLDLQT